MVGKSRNSRRGAAAAIAAAATVLVASCGTLAGEPEPDTVLIGVDLGLTGEGSNLGNVYQSALQLRAEQINQEGLLGDRRVELVVLDNHSDPATSAENVGELAERSDISAVVTGGCDECALSAVDVAEQAGVPTVALGFSRELAEPVSERSYIFKLGPDATHTAAVLANELGRLDAETVAVAASDSRYGGEGAEVMAQAADRAGIEVVHSDQLSGGEDAAQEFAEELLRVTAEQAEADDAAGDAPDQNGQDQGGQDQGGDQSGQDQGEGQGSDPGQATGTGGQQQPPGSGDDAGDDPGGDDPDEQGPDAVVLWVPQATAYQVATALRDQGFAGDFLLDASAAGELFLAGEGGSSLGAARMVFTETLVIDDVIATSPAKAARQNWFGDFSAREGSYHAYSTFAADAVQVLADAVLRFDSTERDDIRAALENTVLDGLSGPIRFRLENHSGLSAQALTMLVAQGDRWRLAAA